MENLPFDKPGRFWKGNLHCHSTASDGFISPEEVCQRYAENGYDFISLTDHFLEVFGFKLTDTRAFRRDGFTTLIGAELHHGLIENGVLWHIVANGLPLDFAPPSPDESASAFVNRAIDMGAFVAIAHPLWYTLSVDDALSLGDRVHAVEIYNTTCEGSDTADGNYMLDLLLAKGRWYNAIATDDAHFKPGRLDSLQNYVMVKAEANEPEALLTALKAGHFYASQGPHIHNIEIVPGEKVIVHTSPVESGVIRSTDAGFVGTGMPAPGGTSYTYSNGHGVTRFDFPLAHINSSWVRLIVRDHLGRRAWSNPFMLTPA